MIFASSLKKSRVVSLLPSATEILCAVGGNHLLVGRSHEDNYPQSITHLPVLTSQLISKEWTDAASVDREVSSALSSGRSLYTLDEELLQSLKPDVILTQDLCSVCSIDLSSVRRVATRLTPQPRVISLNPYSLEEVLADMDVVGEAVGLKDSAVAAREALERRVKSAADVASELIAGNGKGRVKVAFVEWSDPIYVGGHWTPQLISMAGGEHTLNPYNEGNPQYGQSVQIGGTGKSFPVTPEALVASEPDLMIVCPCGLPLEEAEREVDKLMKKDWFRDVKAVREKRVLVVDGDAMFNRPGPRLVDALEWLVSILHSNGTTSTCGASTDRHTLLARAEALRPVGFPFLDYFQNKESAAEASSGSAGARTSVKVDTEPEVDDIEEAHRRACDRGESTYIDPASGYTVFTAVAHRKRGKCCGNKCRHCPYGHFNVRPEIRPLSSLVRQPTLLRVVEKRRRLVDRLSTVGPAWRDAVNAAASLANGSRDVTDVDVVFWSGGKDSYLALLMLESCLVASGAENRRVVLLTTFDKSTGHLAHQGLHCQDIMAQVKKLGIDVFAVPLPSNCGNDEYKRHLIEALTVLQKEIKRDLNGSSLKVTGTGSSDATLPRLRLVFGDLHLQDIRSWREAALADYPLWFPIFGVDYSLLQSALFHQPPAIREFSEICISASSNAGTAGDGSEVAITVGSVYNEDFISQLPKGVDAMGECGEFHTHVKFN